MPTVGGVLHSRGVTYTLSNTILFALETSVFLDTAPEIWDIPTVIGVL
jgi:hypothetical protein